MTGHISIDESRAPLYIVRFDGIAGDDDFNAYLEWMTRLVHKHHPRALVYDATTAGPSPALHRRRQAEWMKEFETETRLLTRGVAFVLPSALMRGVLTAILWLQPMACPHRVVPTLDDGVAWAKGQLDMTRSSLTPKKQGIG